MEKEKVEISVGEAFDNLNRAGWKLQGVAGLFKLKSDNLDITNQEAFGIGFLLEQVAEEVLRNAEDVEAYVNTNTGRLSSEGGVHDE